MSRIAIATVAATLLPQVGIKGNSHMMMMDRNNAEVAGLIQKWLEGKSLTK
jgi:hypothetical protein